jgi:hypothetical protein
VWRCGGEFRRFRAARCPTKAATPARARLGRGCRANQANGVIVVVRVEAHNLAIVINPINDGTPRADCVRIVDLLVGS